VSERLQTAFAVTALLMAGFLLGSFWLGWREPRMGGATGAAGDAASRLPAGAAERPAVEVLNGMGRPGAARRVAEDLRGMGFDVVYFGNAERFDHRRTLVLARSADTAAARRVADSLGVDAVEVEPAPELYVDGTVILGGDWDSLRAARDSLGEGPGSMLEVLGERLGF
jgi:hypothetical protein